LLFELRIPEGSPLQRAHNENTARACALPLDFENRDGKTAEDGPECRRAAREAASQEGKADISLGALRFLKPEVSGFAERSG